MALGSVCNRYGKQSALLACVYYDVFFSSFRGRSLVCMKITNPISIQTRWNPKPTSARDHVRLAVPRRQNLKSWIFQARILGSAGSRANAADYLWRIAPRFRSIPSGNERILPTGGTSDYLLGRPWNRVVISRSHRAFVWILRVFLNPLDVMCCQMLLMYQITLYYRR